MDHRPIRPAFVDAATEATEAAVEAAEVTEATEVMEVTEVTEVMAEVPAKLPDSLHTRYKHSCRCPFLKSNKRGGS